MSENEQRIYEEHILAHFERPYHRGRCSDATHSARCDNPSCGDHVTLELMVCDGQIVEVWHQGAGCLISQASASILSQHLEGRSVEDALGMNAQTMLALFGASLTPRRRHCCLLAWQTLKRALLS